MRVERLTESTPHLLALDLPQVKALRACGKRLASSKTWWGSVAGEEPSGSIIHVNAQDDGLWSVRVNDAIGFVAAPDLQLIVEPKIPIDHLLYLFGLSGAFPRVDSDMLLVARGNSLQEVLARWFLASAERLLRADLLKDYVAIREPLAFVRGTVHPIPTTRSFMTGRIAIDCSYEDFLADTPMNRVVKGAARMLEGLPALSRMTRRRASGITLRMDGVGELRHLDLDVPLDRRSAYYAESVSLALWILTATALDWRVDDRAGRAFLIRTPEMVEAGLRTILAEEFGSRRIVKRQLALTGHSMTMNPDIVAPEDGGVGDIKYKLTADDWSRADLYQVIAFAHAYRASKAVMSTFSSAAALPLPPLSVGGTPITPIAWDANEELSPTAARVAWVAQFGEWLDSQGSAVDIMSIQSH